ncbi:MAG: nickel pincer cofactor biosynthesis protein LarC [Acidobacteria bacterium]|nr:nickel pincer cofactor biosynthesis protein LarC [Acidobacteriota bacterium]
MRTLYLDCFAGASGDMLLGALLDLGLDFAFLKAELAKLGVPGYELSLTRVDRSGISAAKFDVHLQREAHHHHDHDHGHHDHDHDHDHGHHHHEHDHGHHHHDHGHHDHDHDHGHHHHEHEHHHHEHEHEHHHRGLTEIKRLISAASLSDSVKARAQAIFQRIGEAEAKIHGMPIEAVHFHEVGAIDSIVDIVGACIGLEALGIGRIISSPLHVGSGTFKCAHGIYPVPGPATTELLKGVPLYAKDIQGELVTPTGAAIIATLAERFAPMPLMRVEKIGYGAGTRTYPNFPNVLRAVLGQLAEDADATPGTVTVIEAQIDDLNPQVFGHLMEQALAAGALDLFYTPVQMKKNRPGVLLTLLCKPEDRVPMCDMLFRETTTLGVRYRQEEREILQRDFTTAETPYGPIRLKIARRQNGEVMNVSPEFEDCHAAAAQHGVSLREVQLAALTAASRQ